MIIIPAIDILNGKCVRLTRGDYSQQKLYNDDPVEVAKKFEAAGLKRLHLVDLDGAKAGSVRNLAILEKISAAVNMVIDFGGGVKKDSDVESVFNAGASLVTIGSLAVQAPATLARWLLQFGVQRFFIGADVLNAKVKISGWLEDGGIDVFDFLESMKQLGVTNVFCTDIERDGMMQGPAVELYKKIVQRHPAMKLVASGGVSNMQDLEQLNEAGCAAVIVGKAIYENLITLQDVINFNTKP